GELYFLEWHRDDFSVTLPFLQHLFIHEMSHVWQRARGMNVIGRGLVSWMVSYRYKLDGRLLSEYPMEQQAQIIADNFTLQTVGYNKWGNLRNQGDITLDGDISEAVIRQKYKNALRGFPW
ncbi:type VI secretion protein, partial [Buttiauxella noackiae]|uniref:type VI secretion protein n=1 Tax=Buttiauxella noackiae TaxID=82992 RepID=UPI0035A63E2E